jgi:Flp pilus assembly protein TadG
VIPALGRFTPMLTVMKRTAPKNHSAREAFLSLELALTLPVFIGLLFALFEFSLLFAARSSIVHAGRVGARQGATPGVAHTEVETAVRSVLQPRLRNAAEVAVEPGRHTGDVVTVSITVPMSKAAPNLLWPIGFDLRGRELSTTTRMVKE